MNKRQKKRKQTSFTFKGTLKVANIELDKIYLRVVIKRKLANPMFKDTVNYWWTNCENLMGSADGHSGGLS